MHIFSACRGKAFSSRYGKPAWLNTTKWKALPGSGRVSTEPQERPRWRPSVWAPTPRTGGKKGRKRSLLVDARGIPLSLVASGANVHDVKLLTITLDKMVCKRPRPRKGHQQRLCADAGYKGDPATKAVLARLYRPHIKQRKEEADAKRQKPGYNRQTMGCGADALLAESLSQTSDKLRKNGSQLYCAIDPRCRFDLLEADYFSLRIRSKHAFKFFLLGDERFGNDDIDRGHASPLYSRGYSRWSTLRRYVGETYSEDGIEMVWTRLTKNSSAENGTGPTRNRLTRLRRGDPAPAVAVRLR